MCVCVCVCEITVICFKSWIHRIFGWKVLIFVDFSGEAPENLTYSKSLQIFNGKFETKTQTSFFQI